MIYFPLGANPVLLLKETCSGQNTLVVRSRVRCKGQAEETVGGIVLG